MMTRVEWAFKQGLMLRQPVAELSFNENSVKTKKLKRNVDL